VSSSATSIFGTRQAGNLLTKISWWGGGAFLALAFMLSLMSTRSRRPASVLEGLQAPPTAPATAPPISAPGQPGAVPPLGGRKGPDSGRQ
jgi:preprotein translocase subunit SecG